MDISAGPIRIEVVEPPPLEEVYRQLLTRLPDIEYARGIEVAPNNFVHAIRKLPVRFRPERRS